MHHSLESFACGVVTVLVGLSLSGRAHRVSQMSAEMDRCGAQFVRWSAHLSDGAPDLSNRVLSLKLECRVTCDGEVSANAKAAANQ